MGTFSLLDKVLRPLLLTLLLPQLLCGFQALWLSPLGWLCLLYLLPAISAFQALLTLGFWTIRSSGTDTHHGGCEDGPSRSHVKRLDLCPLVSWGAFAREVLSCVSAPLSSFSSSLICFLFFTVGSLPFSSANLLFFRAHTGPTHRGLCHALQRAWLGLWTCKDSPFKYQEAHCPWLLVLYCKSVRTEAILSWIVQLGMIWA